MSSLPRLPISTALRGSLQLFLGLALALPTLTLLPTAQAQQGGGTVAGAVVDSSTGKFLEGADIAVEGTSLHAITERDGAFQLRDVPAGPHNVIVSYPGLESKTSAVTVTAGQTATVDVRLLGTDIVTLSAFKVAGTKEGMAQAIALQKLATNSKVVAAGDQYGDIAEGNAAEYLKFLPGVGIDYNANDARAATLRGMSTAFTNVTMNGNPLASATSGNLNRRFEFEQVAINNVETIEVFKTLTPEMQATSTGGSINLVTKSAFDQQGSLGTYRVYFQGIGDDLYFRKSEGWGQELTRKILPGIDINYGARLRDNLGINISYKNSQLFNDYPRSSYTWEYNPANGGLPNAPALTSWNLQNEQKDTRRQSFSGQIDYKIAEHTKLSVMGQWNFYDLSFTDRVITVNTGTLAALSTASAPNITSNTVTGRAGAGSVVLGTINRWKSGVTWDGTANLTHDFDNGGKLEASTYWSQAYSKYRDSTGGWYSDANLTRSNLTVNFGNVGGVVPSYTAFDSTGAAVDLRDISKYTVTQIRSRPQTGVDTRDGVSLDYKTTLNTSVPVGLKVGGRVDITSRNISNPAYTRTAFSPAITGTQLAGMADTNFSNHPIGYGLPAYNFISLYSAYSQLGGMNFIPYVPASDTQARFDDTTNAGYVRLDVTPVKNFLVVGGFRYEDRVTDTENRLSTLPSIIRSKFSDRSWYPSINLKYTPTKSLVFRFGAAKSIGLPDYSDLLPGAPSVTDPNSSTGARGKVSIYNPSLSAYRVVNLDAGVEYYFGQSGVASVSVFRKDFSNYIITATQSLTADSAAKLGIDPKSLQSSVDQYDITTKFNVPETGHYNGIEAGYSQNLSFLPKPFNTISLQINGTILSVDPINSKLVFSSTDANLNRTILQQINKNLELAAVKQALNVGLNYSYGKFGFNVITNYTGHVLKAVVQKTVKYSNVAINDYYNELQYQAPRELVDVRIDYKWSRKFTPYFQARNIFGRSIVMSTPSLPFNHAEYGDPIYELGVRGAW